MAWISDLMSGKFRKGYGALLQRDVSGNHNFCCLGVACKTLQKLKPSLDITFEFDNPGECSGEVLGDDISLHEDLINVLRLRDGYGRFKEPVRAYDPENNREVDIVNLSNLNDTAKWSHRKIGEYILANPGNVFV